MFANIVHCQVHAAYTINAKCCLPFNPYPSMRYETVHKDISAVQQTKCEHLSDQHPGP